MTEVCRLVVTCCGCEKEYYLDEGYQAIFLMADSEYKGVTLVIGCPFCGHNYNILIDKIKEQKE